MYYALKCTYQVVLKVLLNTTTGDFPHSILAVSQAIARCYRIGQTKPVLVFRFATANSVDGHMIRTAAKKNAMGRLVLKRGEFKHEAAEVL